MLGGTFTPLTSAVDVEVDWAGTVTGVAHVSTHFAWNQTVSAGTALMTGQGILLSPYIANTSSVNIEGAGGATTMAGANRRFRITGLTPGTPVVWEVGMGSTGYFEAIAAEAGGLYAGMGLSADNQLLYVTDYNLDKVHIFRPGNSWAGGNYAKFEKVGELVGHDTVIDVVAHPTNANLVYLALPTPGKVREVDVRTNQIVRSWDVPLVEFLTIHPDGSYLFATERYSHTPINLGTGVKGTTVALAGSYLQKPAIASNGVHYIAGTLSDTIYRFTATGTANGTLAAGGAYDPVATSLNADGTRLWVLEQAMDRARSIDTGTFTWSADTAVTGMAAATPYDMRVSPTGKSMIITGTSPGSYNSFVLPARSTAFETSDLGYSLGRLMLGPEGDIYATKVDGSALVHWHSVDLRIIPSDQPWGPFWGGHLDVSVSPAEAS